MLTFPVASLLADIGQSLFTLKVPVIEKIIRPIVVYVVLVILLRAFGKRELAQANPFDLVVLLSASNTVQNAIIGDDNSLIGGLIGAVTLFGTNYLTVRFLFRHRRFDELLEGKPTVLVANGKVSRDSLAKELLSESELLTIAHKQGFDSLDEVDHCTLEPGGVFVMKGKTPSSDSQRFSQIMDKLAMLEQRLDALPKRVN